MRHGDEIRILVDGLSISPKSLEPIGISHRSQCWGIWIEKRLREGEKYDPSVPLDFIISPIHPRLWPFVFRIEVALQSVRGTLRSLTRHLLENDVNILLLDQSPSGYTHSIFNAICAFDLDDEMFKALDDMENKIYNIRRNAANPEMGTQVQSWDELEKAIEEVRLQSFQALGTTMMARLSGLWACLRHAAHLPDNEMDSQDRSFLARRVVEEGLDPWFSPILTPDGIFLEVDPSKVVDEQDITKVLQERTELSTRVMDGILDAKFPPKSGKTVRELLLAMMKDHLKTRGSNKCEPTTQALLACIPDNIWPIHIVRRLAWRHVHLPLHVQSLTRLAEMRFWMSPHDPIEFNYDAKRCLLKPTDRDRFLAQVKDLGKSGNVDADKPIWALAAFHHEDRYLRLRLLPSRTETKRVRIEIHYQIPGVSVPEPHFVDLPNMGARSKGLLSTITFAIAKRRGNVLRATNNLAVFDPNSGEESGKIWLVAEFESEEWPGEKIEQLREVLRDSVNSVINSHEDPKNHELINNSKYSWNSSDNCRNIPSRAICSVEVIPFERERVFVSTVFGHGRIRDFRRILDKVASRYGLEICYAEQFTQSVRYNVHDEISKCLYFLQIVTPRAEDRPRMQLDPNFVPDFSWITYELGCAVALQHANPSRKCIQMVDQLLSETVVRRIQLTQGDVAPIIFRIDDDDQNLEEQFSYAIKALIGDQ